MRLARARPLTASVKYSNVPESVPGPNSLIGTSGKPARTSFQLSTFEPGSQIFFSSATERQVAQVFCWFTTTVSASLATVNARHEPTLLVLQDCASEILIGRDAFERSISFLQKRWKPPPVPEMPTVTFTFEAPAWEKSSAPAVVYGPTVDDPSAVIEPPSDLRLNVGFWADAPTATEAIASAATNPPATATPRRPRECFIVCPNSSGRMTLIAAMVATGAPRWAVKE